MESLTALDDCVAQALQGIVPVLADHVALPTARGAVLAEDIVFPRDMPPAAEALRAGFAVSALDLMGASAGVPVPLAAPQRVAPGAPLPPGTDAVLPEDGADRDGSGWEAVRPVGPGEGTRRAGHDGRAGAPLVRAGSRLSPTVCLAAGLAGVEHCAVRRPRVAIALPEPRHAAFAAAWMAALGADLSDAAPHLILQPSADPRPRLALAPAETAWLASEAHALVLSVPVRFDAAVTACLVLGLRAMAALTGACPLAETRPLTRKLTSALGLSELVLLFGDDGGWRPAPSGSVTLSALAQAEAFAILAPDSEGRPEGAMLTGISLNAPLG